MGEEIGDGAVALRVVAVFATGDTVARDVSDRAVYAVYAVAETFVSSPT